MGPPAVPVGLSVSGCAGEVGNKASVVPVQAQEGVYLCLCGWSGPVAHHFNLLLLGLEQASSDGIAQVLGLILANAALGRVGRETCSSECLEYLA